MSVAGARREDEVATARLMLRPLRDRDIPALYAIQSQREAMRFTYAAPSLQACELRLRAYEDTRARHGFAPWVAVDRSNDKVLGWGGLSIDPFDPDWGVELSYLFDPSCWGRGLATELALACVDHAFKNLRLSRLSAFAMPGNVASIRVLEKCGFTFLRYEPRLERNHYQVLPAG